MSSCPPLMSSPDHPRYVAYNEVNDDFTIYTVLSHKGGRFVTTVWDNRGSLDQIEIAEEYSTICRQEAVTRHMNMLDKYTFYRRTHE